MNELRIRPLLALVLAPAICMATDLAAQERVEERACAELLPAIESLEVMLAQEAKARATDAEIQRMQVVMSLLNLRYRNIEALGSSLRAAETEDDDIRSAMARGQAQIEAFDEAERNAATVAPDLGVQSPARRGPGDPEGARRAGERTSGAEGRLSGTACPRTAGHREARGRRPRLAREGAVAWGGHSF